MKKTIIVFVILFATMIVLQGCEVGLRYVKIEVAALPDKTVYYCGKDQYLDFTGGAVILETANGTKETVPMQEYTYLSHYQSRLGEPQVSLGGGFISSDVNFYIPGEYTVIIWQTKKVYCQFNVSVLP